MSTATITVEAFVANELEVRQAGDHRVVDVSLPHTPRKFDKSRNEWVDAGDTVWFQATFWDEHVEPILQAVEKGSLVTVTGTPELEAYAKRDGTPGAKIKLAFPTIAVVVRRPRRGEVPAEPWGASSESSGGSRVGSAVDEWNAGGSLSDDSSVPY